MKKKEIPMDTEACTVMFCQTSKEEIIWNPLQTHLENRKEHFPVPPVRLVLAWHKGTIEHYASWTQMQNSRTKY